MRLGKINVKKHNDVIHDLKWNILWGEVAEEVSSSIFDGVDSDLWNKFDNSSNLILFSLLEGFYEEQLTKFLNEIRETKK